MYALTMSAARRRDKVVILTGIRYGVTPKSNLILDAGKMLSRTLTMAWSRTRCKCTPRRILHALFSSKVTALVAFLVITSMWWHNFSIDGTICRQEAVATDCLYALPWAFVWALRASCTPSIKKGGNNARI